MEKKEAKKPELPMNCHTIEIHNFKGGSMSLFTFFFERRETISHQVLRSSDENKGATVSIGIRPFLQRNEDTFTEFFSYMKKEYPEAEILFF